ncbi:MAG: class C beta-lactamase-related serine hydrolase [Deltaproteobacteria bacterium]|nr:MAG: class C beta-lactamase-related serine hydrolase [Deltaproteobacteria bacterium]
MKARGMIGLGVGAAAMIGLGVGGYLLSQVIAPKGAGYHAKILCSGVFVAGRPAAHLLESDLGRFWYVQGEVDRQARTVTSSLYGLGSSTALYRPGLGCTLARGEGVEALRAQTPRVSGPRDTRGLPWPTGDLGAEPTPLPRTDPEALQAAIDQAFSDPDQGTRAVVVVQGGQLVAEAYAEGFSASTPLSGWSMTKSVTSTLIALAADEGLIDISQPAGLPEWQGDPRAELTVDHLLRMSSGLDFSEVYGAFGDATHMLFVAPSTVEYAAQSPLAHEPDMVWSYSSGTSNLLQRILRRAVGEDRYLNFPRRALFDRIGMRSAVIEPDAAGDFVGSSFMYATARDWARFGLLHLQDGTWEGERVLPEAWVEYATTPTEAAPKGEYGAQWWLNAGNPDDPSDRRWPDLPLDAYDASGFEGQNVLVVPSHDVVIVRLGLTPDREKWNFGAFAAGVLAALPDTPPVASRLQAEVPEAQPVDRAVYVHLGDQAWGERSAAILSEDWEELIQRREDLRHDPHGVRWFGHPAERPVLLRLERGVIVAPEPDRPTLALLLELAEELDARVTGDLGARYVVDPEAPGGVGERRP